MCHKVCNILLPYAVCISVFNVRVDNPRKHFFFCESDLHKKLGPRPSEYFYKAKEICEEANSSLSTSLEPNFNFESQI